ncbi:MAG TPA: hypothetical protein EYP17_08585 [Candidatus Latescibacteria bacterium]|nr:hypothetical protein [Candidatus Latescibacterota bacterium]
MRELLGKLRKAAKEEHIVVQYLCYTIGEEACEIEAIARDEIRYFWMLCRDHEKLFARLLK